MPRRIRGITWLFFAFFAFAYTHIWIPFGSWLVSCLSLPEEGVKSTLRELIAVIYRSVNGISAIFVSVFIDRSYRKKKHSSAWSDVESERTWTQGTISTLNAIVEREISDKNEGSKLSRYVNPLKRHNPRFQGQTTPADSDMSTPAMQASSLLPYNLAAVSYDRGVLEDTIIYLEVVVTKFFAGVRMLLSMLLLIPPAANRAVEPKPNSRKRRTSFHTMARASCHGNSPGEEPNHTLHRSKSTGLMEDVPRKQESQRSGNVSVAGLIRACGYPAEEHTVVTSDGYCLRMDRIPRHNCKRVVFFVHGVLDTSLSWVCSGVTESQAFAAWDDGTDCWLANCRSNPPRQHVDPSFQGPAYWHYTVNELGLHDLHAQIDYIHNYKCRELGAGIMTMPRVAMPSSSRKSVPRPSTARAHASEDNASARSQAAATSTANTSWRARTDTHVQHASDSDLTALETGEAATDQQHSELHKSAMSSGLYRSKAECTRSQPRNSAESTDSPGCSATVSHRLSLALNTKQQSSQSRATDAAPEGAAAGKLGNSAGPDHEPSVSSMSTPFEPNGSAEQGGTQSLSSEAYTTPTARSHLLSPSTSSLPSDGQENVPPDKAGSFFTWLPGVAEAEHQALQLGVERTSPYFLDRDISQPLKEIVEINISDCRMNSSTSTLSYRSSPAFQRSHRSGASTTRSCPAKPGYANHVCNVPGAVLGTDADSVAPHTHSAPAAGGGPCEPQSACQSMANEDSKRPGLPLPLCQDVHEPYVLTAVGHSLGGAALLMYVVQFRRTNRRHRLSRLVLLTPAGFIEKIPVGLKPIALILPGLLRITTALFPAVLSLPFYVPSSFLRSLMFRLTADVRSMPAATKLIRAFVAMCTNGDTSQWEQAMRMPHYTSSAMPAVSLLQAKHMLQWINTGRFAMFDYGSRDLNLAAYGQSTPVDLAAEYWRIDVPVDFCAGKNDGIITPGCVRKHRNHMMAAGVSNVTYREFDFGHLDFTFSAQQDLRHYVISCIQHGPDS